MRWAGANLMRLDVTRRSAPEWAIERHVRVAREIGCRGLETRMVSGKLLRPDLPLSERRRIADLVAAAGLEICVVSSDCRFVKPTAIARSREIDRWTGFINLAQEWGASIVRVFGGRYDYTVPPSEADSWVEEGLCAMCAMPETDGIRVALETHDDFNSRVRGGRILRSAGTTGCRGRVRYGPSSCSG